MRMSGLQFIHWWSNLSIPCCRCLTLSFYLLLAVSFCIFLPTRVHTLATCCNFAFFPASRSVSIDFPSRTNRKLHFLRARWIRTCPPEPRAALLGFPPAQELWWSGWCTSFLLRSEFFQFLWIISSWKRSCWKVISKSLCSSGRLLNILHQLGKIFLSATNCIHRRWNPGIFLLISFSTRFPGIHNEPLYKPNPRLYKEFWGQKKFHLITNPSRIKRILLITNLWPLPSDTL